MHLVFDIFQAVGIAAAVGIRPFLPALAVGGLAAAHVQINLAHTDLQLPPGRAVPARRRRPGGRAGLIAERRFARPQRSSEGRQRSCSPPRQLRSARCFFAGELCRGHAIIWPGYPAGIVCAAVGIAASRPLFARVRARLDEGTARALLFYAELTALLAAVLSVLAPPVGVVVLALLVWLLIAGRGRGDQKYAGLRILR